MLKFNALIAHYHSFFLKSRSITYVYTMYTSKYASRVSSSRHDATAKAILNVIKINNEKKNDILEYGHKY